MEASLRKQPLRVVHSNVTIHTQPLAVGQCSISYWFMAPAASFSGKLIFICDSLCSPLSPDSEVTVCPAASIFC